MKQCERGHFFDEVRYEDCPYCKNAEQNMGKTIGISPIADVGKTMPLGKSSSLPDDRGKTVGLIKKDIGIDPAVGFIVCIKGIHKGENFTLHAGRNFIGRASNMDISLPDDETVSRETHAIISYDKKNNSFLIAPGQGRGITYLNSAEVPNAQPLLAYDKIEVGKSNLLFLPLCGEKFVWE